METAAVIAITVVVAIVIIAFISYIIKLNYEHRLRSEIEQARKSAVQQSRAVLGGKFTEQMVPFFPDFKYDPTEVRFIGTPIDMVVFPGLAQGDPQEVVILEVKTGKSAVLNPVQKKIRRLIEDGMVRWEELYRHIEEDGRNSNIDWEA